jgi:hypothetical protein
MALKNIIKDKNKIYDGKQFLNKITLVYLISILMLGTVVPIAHSDPSDPWYNNDWIYRKEIIIDHTKVDTDLANFPVLIALSTDSNLATHAQSDGDDIVFTDTNGNKLSHEIEAFQSATGHLIAWVNVPSLSSDTDVSIYLYYGNNQSGNQQNPQETWNSDYLMVHHMNETGNIIDSTSNELNAVNYGTTSDPNGMIDGCRYFDSTTDRYDFGNPSLLNPGINSWTISMWTKIDYVQSITLRKWGSNAGFILWMYNGWGGYNYFKVSDGIKTSYRYWNASFSDGNWHYLTAVINRDTNQLDLYLDGVSHNGYASGNLVGMGNIATTTSCLLYGGTNGRHDEFTISTTIRNESWIKTSYNNQNNPSSFYSLGSEEQAPSYNRRPILLNEIPQNGSTVNINQPTVSVTIQDPDGDPFNWYINGPHVISAQQIGASNGTKTANLVTPLPPNAEIVWHVNVTDPNGSGKWTNETFSFFTESEPSPWWNTEWNYRKEISIDHSKVDANLVDFPVLISLPSDAGLAAHAQSNGNDIVFTDFNGNKLNHEIEAYQSTTGRFVAWVNVPALSLSTDTVLYMYYGNSASGYQQNPQGTWNSDYLMVHHMNETGNIIDSTSNGLNAVNYGTTTDTNGMIDGCHYFDSTTDRYDFGNPSLLNPGMSSWTISLWTKIDYIGSYQILRKWSSGMGFNIFMYYGGGTTRYNYLQVSDGIKTTYRYWNASWSDGSWHLITAVINRNTNKLDMYLDGTLHNGYQSSAGDLTGMGSITSSANFLLYGGTNGRHDEFSVSTTVRNVSWIKTSYNNQNNPSGFFTLGNEEQTSPYNHRPTLSNEIPQNGAIVGLNQASVSITIHDPDGDPFNWYIHGPYVISAQQIGASNGTKTANLNIPLPPNTEIFWYVNVTDSSGSGLWTNATYHFTTVTSVMPTLKHIINPGIGLSAVGPLAADVNNDGQIEIIRSGETGIVVLDGESGAIIWKRIMNMHNDHCPMEIIDLNKDGILEIICSHENGTTALYGNNGSTYWYNPDAPLHNKYPVAGDINADGYPEVYVCTHGQVTALTHDGEIFAQTWTYYPCFGGLTLGDTDYDGVFELYQGDRSNYYPQEGSGGRGCVAYWASNLTYRWSHPELLASSQCPTLADVDKDGKLDVVICSQSGGGFCVYNSTNGDIIHQSLRIPGVRTHSQAPIYDIDGDGNLEIIACRDWSKPIVWDLYLWQEDAWLPYECYEPPALADIDGDGFVEIISCSRTNISIFNHHYQLLGNISLSNPDNYGMSMIVAQDIDDDGLIELIFNRISSIYVYDTLGPAPSPRALSQFNFYSQLRGRAPYYVPYGPLKPLAMNENPTNGQTNIPNNPQLSVYIYDYQQDLMTITFETNASTGVWHTLKTYSNIHDGTYTASTTGMNVPLKMYWWRITVTDSTGKSTIKVFKFRIIGTIKISNIKPADLDRDIELNPQLSVDAEQRNGLPMTIRFLTNVSGNWIIIGSNSSVYNGTYKQKPTNMTTYDKKYFWGVQCYDGLYWTNETFSFTTFKPSTAQWYNLNWTNRKLITVNHTKINTNIINFPILINLPADANLASHAQPDGDDILFADKYGNKLNHEIETYQSATGRLIAWVNIPNLSSITDTNLYLYYGNGASGNQQNPQATWNSDYLMVHHMEETGNIIDSTLNGLNAVNYGTTTDSNGMIAGSRYFNSLTDRYDFGNPVALNPGMSSWTITLWTKIVHVDSSIMLRKWGSNAGFILYLYNGWGGTNYFKVGDGTHTTYRYWNTPWSDGTWHYITIVINRNTNLIDLYLDGLLNNGGGSANIAGFESLTTSANFLLYGGINGRHDEFTVSTTVRNASWVRASYDNQNDPSSFYKIYPEEPIPPAAVNVSNPEPPNGEIDIQLSPQLRITVIHNLGYLMNINWKTNASGSWTTIGSNSSVPTGTYSCNNTPWANAYYKRYWWRVEVHDYHGHWMNSTFTFRTIIGAPTHGTPLLVLSSRKLICYNQSTSDPNGFEVYNTYQWIKNGTSLTRLLLPFNTMNQTNVKDYSGYNNNGVITGATWIPDGVIGGAYYFSGLDSFDYISLPHSNSLDGGGTWNAITIEHWIYLSDNQTGSRIIAKMSSSSEAKRSYEIGISNSMPANKLYGGVIIGSNIYKEVIYNTSLAADQWYHVALTYKSGVGVKLYLNGTQVATNTNQTTGNIQASPGKILCIGAYNGSGSYLAGAVDEVKIYPIALTSQQIYQDYLQERNGFSSNSTMVDEETLTGEQWKCAITPSNSYFDGLTKTSNTITIPN